MNSNSSSSSTIERSQTHATFVLERTYPVAVQAVWHALSDNAARDQWFGGGPEFDIGDKSHEFRIGGHGVEELMRFVADRKSTRLNSSHLGISYAVFCLKKKNR